MSSQLHLWSDLRPVEHLRWSISRDKRLRDCLRKYYFYHYASHGGKRAEEGSAAHTLYILKHLRNRFMWVGEIVHELVEACLQQWRGGQDVSLDALIQRGTRRMRSHFAESLHADYRKRPTQACGLVEHEYAEPVSRDEWQRQRDRMERCLRHFFELPLSVQIRKTPAWSWLALEAMSSFELDGATIVVKPDLAWRKACGRVVLVDWKTGQPRDDDKVQMAVYGLFAQRVWGLGADSLEAKLVYLDVGQVDTFELGREQLQRAESDVRASVALMRQLARSGPPPDPAHFPCTDNLGSCNHCTFRRVCDRAQLPDAQ